jgi:DNA-binding transcriptional LysR family regulator
MADVYGIIDGVAMGMGRAVVPRHMLADRADVRVLPDYRAQATGIWLHHYTLPYYSRLQQAVVELLRGSCPSTLAIGGTPTEGIL